MVAAALAATFAGVAPGAQAQAIDPGLVSRAVAADSYAKSRPGVTGIVVYDRTTGAMWENGNANTPVWACSTAKLEMVADLLLRNESGAITLSDDDRDLMHRMLNVSDDNAADTLWKRYGGSSFGGDLGRFGMTSTTFRTPQSPYWGWERTTAADLDRLINSALSQLNSDDRDYLVSEMRSVGSDQQWGVWGAGAAAQPGTKDGWSNDNSDGSWLDNSVGFVGPDERYTVAITGNTETVAGGDQIGRATDTQVANLLFQGYFG
ncbi:serine hydrolase [Nocardia sp. NPDC020380]|uniref:serine hydrolase n=1 Tax=Nocardia sp. NPDC020380 TaxID=3364309 RepID=UPI0037BB6E9D